MTEDKILQRATLRRNNLRRQLLEIEAFIGLYRQLAASGDEAPDKSVTVETRKPYLREVEQQLERYLEAKPIRSAPIAMVARAVREALNTAGCPMSTVAILEDITRRGVVIGGKEPRWNLSAKLSRNPHIINLEGHGWWFKNRPCEAVGYIPPQETEGPDESQSSGPSDESGDSPLNS